MQFKQNTHQYWMNEAIEFIKGNVAEVPVSALIVKNNKLISKATNLVENNNSAIEHAEIIVIKEASKILNNWRLDGCTLYVTLEPCSMCAGAIINSRISTVVFGAYDVNRGACGSKLNLFYELEQPKHVEIIGGILENKCSQLLKDFFMIKRIDSH